MILCSVCKQGLVEQEGDRCKNCRIRKMSRTDKALNIWASYVHNEASWGAPVTVEDVFKDPVETEDTFRECDRSDQLYQASADKYEKHPRAGMDPGVVDAVLVVESALEKFTGDDLETLKMYLLFVYPTCGRWTPLVKYHRSADPEFAPAKAFVLTSGIGGGDPRSYKFKAVVKLVKKLKYDFTGVLMDVMGIERRAS